MKPRTFIGALLLTALSCPSLSPAADVQPKLLLKKGDRVAIVGDSITEGKSYSRLIDLYFAACLPQLDLHLLHLGWSGATVQGFRGRMELDLLPYKPNVVTICYGMNDGGYAAFAPAMGEAYATHLGFVVEAMKKTGATVIVGSPGAVDTRYFATAEIYNQTLGKLRDRARQIAEAQQMPFADIHDPLCASMAKAKAALGNDFPVCGRDGIHPGMDGALIMAYVFLKAMGVDGDIGTITLDMKGTATASEGHKILSSQGGQAEIESTRYPFCFTGDEKSPDGTRSMMPFVAFNQDLNRFRLVVKNLAGERATVTWGTESKVFPKKDLESGINLAEAFAEKNPFLANFQKADAAVYAKQVLESECKQVIEDINDLTAQGTESAAQLDKIRRKADETLEASRVGVRAVLSPVKYTLTVTPEA